jgi:DNA-binding beta-propeller fold protein YncE
LAIGNVRSPSGRNSTSHNRAAGPKAFLCALALGTLLASVASAQVVEGCIQLPDSFGHILGSYSLAWDRTPGFERLFVGGDSGDVIVIDAVNVRKLARIPTGPVTSLCYCTAENKLYAATPSPYSVVIVDCSSYQVLKQLPMGGKTAWVFYNPLVNRVYCGTPSVKVIDCASDSVVGTIPVVGPGSSTCLDTMHNKLYLGAGDGLKVVDCYSDSVVAAIQRVQGATALCFNPNPSGDQVYAGVDETLYVVDVKKDSVVTQIAMPCSVYALCSDPVHNRVYGAWWVDIAGIDCATNTVLWEQVVGIDPWGLTCAPDLGRVYLTMGLVIATLDGSTGQITAENRADDRMVPTYLDRLDRLFCISEGGRVFVVDCSGDTFQALLPLAARAESACLDTVNDKLYFTYGGRCGYVGVADCSSRLARSYIRCGLPQCMVHDATDGKLYVSTWDRPNGDCGSVSVFNCANDSLLEVIPTGYVKGGIRWHSEFNKLYAGVSDTLGQCYVAVIDCDTDSVIRILGRGNPDDALWHSLLSTEHDQFWGISPNGYTVVDCQGDSIVIDTLTGYWNPRGACYSAAERKVYVAHGSSELTVLSMESLRPAKKVSLCSGDPEVMLSVSAAGKIYVAATTPMSTTDSICAVDTRTDSVVSRLDAGHIITAMCDDVTGRYVYCAALRTEGPYVVSETLLVVDTQCDSIVSGVSLPGMVLGAGEWLVPNRRTGRIYAGGWAPNGRLLAIRDSVVIGLEEWRHAKTGSVMQQTVVSRCVPLLSAAEADLYDASGRRAGVLRAGPNDISRLVPGVYFVRERPKAQSLERQVVRKLVIA